MRPLWERQLRLTAERTQKGLNLLDIEAWEDDGMDQTTQQAQEDSVEDQSHD